MLNKIYQDSDKRKVLSVISLEYKFFHSIKEQARLISDSIKLRLKTSDKIALIISASNEQAEKIISNNYTNYKCFLNSENIESQLFKEIYALLTKEEKARIRLLPLTTFSEDNNDSDNLIKAGYINRDLANIQKHLLNEGFDVIGVSANDRYIEDAINLGDEQWLNNTVINASPLPISHAQFIEIQLAKLEKDPRATIDILNQDMYVAIKTSEDEDASSSILEELNLDSLKISIFDAIKNYIAHNRSLNDSSNTSATSRGNYGCFTRFRHGNKGIIRAELLKNHLEESNSIENYVEILETFFKKAPFNRHSLTSYLLDKMAENLKLNKNDRYTYKDWDTVFKAKLEQLSLGSVQNSL